MLRRIDFVCWFVAGTLEHQPASSSYSCPLSIERLLDSHHTVASANSLPSLFIQSYPFGRESFAPAFDVDPVSEGEILNPCLSRCSGRGTENRQYLHSNWSWCSVMTASKLSSVMYVGIDVYFVSRNVLDKFSKGLDLYLEVLLAPNIRPIRIRELIALDMKR